MRPPGAGCFRRCVQPPFCGVGGAGVSVAGAGCDFPLAPREGGNIMRYLDFVDGFLKPAAGRDSRVGAALAEAVREILTAEAERTIERGQIVSFLRSSGWSTADIDSYLTGALEGAEALKDEVAPLERGLSIRDNWINGNRTDALEKAGADAAGAVAAYGALAVFERGTDEAEEFASALIRADANYRG